MARPQPPRLTARLTPIGVLLTALTETLPRHRCGSACWRLLGAGLVVYKDSSEMFVLSPLHPRTRGLLR